MVCIYAFQKVFSNNISLFVPVVSVLLCVFLFQVDEAHTVVKVCLLTIRCHLIYSPCIVSLLLCCLCAMCTFSGQRSAVVIKVCLLNLLRLEDIIIISSPPSLLLFSLLSLLSLSCSVVSSVLCVLFQVKEAQQSRYDVCKTYFALKISLLSISASVVPVVPVVSLLFCCICAMCSFSGQRSAVVKVVYLYLYYFYYYS